MAYVVHGPKQSADLVQEHMRLPIGQVSLPQLRFQLLGLSFQGAGKGKDSLHLLFRGFLLGDVVEDDVPQLDAFSLQQILLRYELA